MLNNLNKIKDDTIKKLPINGIDVQITERCNLACSFCVNANGNGVGGTAKLPQLLQAIRELYEYNPDYLGIIHITGGEPTLVTPLIIDLLKQLPNQGKGITKRVVSNGLFDLLKSDIATMLDMIDIIKISYDTTRPETLITTRRGTQKNDLSRIENTIAMCCEKEGIEVQLRTALSRDNLDELIPIYEKAREWGVDLFQIKPIINSGRAIVHPELQAEFALLYAAIERFYHFTQKFSDPGKTKVSIQCFLPGEIIGFPTKRCAMSKRLYLGVDGTVRLCNFLETPIFGNYLEEGGIRRILEERARLGSTLFNVYGVPCSCPSTAIYQKAVKNDLGIL